MGTAHAEQDVSLTRQNLLGLVLVLVLVLGLGIVLVLGLGLVLVLVSGLGLGLRLDGSRLRLGPFLGTSTSYC